jgi:hypothetical protein
VSNPYYTYSGSLIPGTLARAEALASELQNIQAGFADLATAGVDSGTGSAYIVTTPAGQPSVTAVDGDVVSFKPLNTNGGPATIAVNNIPAASILRANGSALQALDISGNTWITLTYNSTYSAWTLYVPPAVVTYAGVISGATPVHKVGLVAAGGTLTAAAPIDATYAIDQTIAPTWTSVHAFSSGINVSGTSTFNSLVINGVLAFSTGISVAGTSTFGAITSPGTSTFAALSALNVIGTATFQSGLTAGGTSTSTFNSLVINGTAAFTTGVLQVYGISTFHSLNNAVGIVITGTGVSGWTIHNTGTATTTGNMYAFQDAGYNGFFGITADTTLHVQVNDVDFLTINSAQGVVIRGTNMETTNPALQVGALQTGALTFGAAAFGAGTGWTYGATVLPNPANSSSALQFVTTGTATPGSASTQGWGYFGTGYYGTGTAASPIMTNKPGTSTGNAQWLAVSLNGGLYWIPAVPH